MDHALLPIDSVVVSDSETSVDSGGADGSVGVAGGHSVALVTALCPMLSRATPLLPGGDDASSPPNGLVQTWNII